MERYIFPPAGRLGGTPGTTGFTLLNPDTDEERDIGKIDILEMNTGDVLRLGTQGGGGYGDPLERPATKVWDDVQDGYVSTATARQSYGVVCDPAKGFDAEATEALRKSMRAGPCRQAAQAIRFRPGARCLSPALAFGDA